MICSSGIGFDPVVDGRRLTFGFEGIWQGTAVLYDHATRSLWMHLTGACFEGELAGRRLAPIGTGRHTTWGEWRRTHPDTDVMAPDPRFVDREGDAGYFPRPAARSGRPYLPPLFAPTIQDRDERLPPHALLYGAVVGGRARAWPLAALRSVPAVNERVAGRDVVVLFDAGSRSVAGFSRVVNGRTLTFDVAEGARARDRETGSLWNLDGECVEGTLRGQRLVALHGLLTEWYGWFASHPDTTIFAP